MTIGELIYQQRKKMGYTLEDLGKICGVPKSTVSRWENGIIQKISRDNQEKLCIALQIDPVIFFRRNEILTREEYALLKAYREADQRAKEDAIRMLADHKVKKDEQKVI